MVSDPSSNGLALDVTRTRIGANELTPATSEMTEKRITELDASYNVMTLIVNICFDSSEAFAFFCNGDG